MKKIHCHVDEIEWQQLDDQDWKAFRYKELLNRNRGGCNEFIFGYGEIDPGQCVPLHVHKSELAVNFISGKAIVQLGKRSVSLDANSGAFFPGKVPHCIEAISKETLGFIYTYACHENTNILTDKQ